MAKFGWLLCWRGGQVDTGRGLVRTPTPLVSQSLLVGLKQGDTWPWYGNQY
jgi:hypothetical protein